MIIYCKKCKKNTERVKPDKRCKNDVGRCKECSNKSNRKYYKENKKLFQIYNSQYYHKNKKDCIKRTMNYKHNHKDKIHYLNKSYNLKARIGITWDQKVEMIKNQNYKCKICNIDFKKINEKNIHVDHNHITKKIRGILCQKCNTMLGGACDNIKILNSAIKYLKETN
jgi:hypothetical protein